MYVYYTHQKKKNHHVKYGILRAPFEAFPNFNQVFFLYRLMQ